MRILLFTTIIISSIAFADDVKKCMEARRNTLENTLSICQSALQNTEISSDKKSIVLITMAEYLISQSRFDEAEKILDEAFNSNPKMLENGIFRYNWLRTKGNLHMVKQAYQDALPFYEQAYEIAQMMENPPLTSNSFNDLGAVNLEMGRYRQAILWFEQSLALHQSREDHYRTALTLANIAEIYEVQQQYEKALEYLQMAETSHQENLKQNPEQSSFYQPYLAHVQEDMGNIHNQLNDFERALPLLLKAQKIYQTQDLKSEQVRVLSKLSQLYLNKQQPQQALATIQQTEQLQQLSDAVNIQLGTLEVEAYLRLEQLEQAETKAKLIMDSAQKSNNREQIKRLALLLSEIKQSMGDDQSALSYYKTYNSINQQQLEETFDESLVALQSQIDLEQKQREIFLLEKNQTIRELTISQQRWIFSIIGLLLLGCVTVLLFSLKRKNKERAVLKDEMRSHEQKLRTLSIDTTAIHQAFSDIKIPIMCTDATGTIIFRSKAFQQIQESKSGDEKLEHAYPQLWQQLLNTLNEDEKLDKDLLINNNQIDDVLPQSIDSVWIHQMPFLDDGLAIVFIDEHNNHELALQTADQIRKYSAFNQSLINTLSQTPNLRIQQAEQLIASTKAMQQLNKKLNPMETPQFSDHSLKEALVELMMTCIETWQRSTDTESIDLAEKSGLWLIDIDSGRLRTRTMDRYTDIKKIPRIPRWRQVVKTAHYILSNCKLNIQERQLLNERTETVMQIVRAKALSH
ncbi:tetratricopeptide repeat protein [Marinicella sp. W31]|uniref:tetratricopeptide repeat protein n=1 Tax=Marinicella sp. W31 TaxID=3023713 RepID=UPI003757343E